jgi:cell division protein FtsW (lipid II flippase)
LALLPAFIVFLATILAWKREFFGALLFFLLAIFYVGMAGLNRDWSWYASISGPAVLIGILFLLDWRAKRRGGNKEQSFKPNDL